MTSDLYSSSHLFCAARSGQEAVVKMLLERSDVRADCTDDRGQIPLSLASEYGPEAVVRMLLEQSDVIVDFKNHEDCAALLSYAAQRAHETVVKALVSKRTR